MGIIGILMISALCAFQNSRAIFSWPLHAAGLYVRTQTGSTGSDVHEALEQCASWSCAADAS